MSNPNSQQVSKLADEEGFSLRYPFGPAPGREWWKMDAKNIELRIPFYESGEQELIDLFERSREPPFFGSVHLLNFSIVYPDLWDDALKRFGLEKAGAWIKSDKGYGSTWYQWCKNGDFAIQYNCGEATADAAFHRAGSFKRLKSRFKKLEILNQRCIAFARKHGYVETIPDRSVNPRRGYPLLCSRTERGDILSTVPLNYRTQGTACWVKLQGMVRCGEQLEEWEREGFDGYICLEVHDELIFDFPKGGDPRKDQFLVTSVPMEFRTSNLWRAKVLQRLLEQGGKDIGIPLPVSCSWHESTWSEGVEL